MGCKLIVKSILLLLLYALLMRHTIMCFFSGQDTIRHYSKRIFDSLFKFINKAYIHYIINIVIKCIATQSAINTVIWRLHDEIYPRGQICPRGQIYPLGQICPWGIFGARLYGISRK